MRRVRSWYFAKSKIEGVQHVLVVGNNTETSTIAARLMETASGQVVVTKLISALEEDLTPADVVYVTGSVPREQRENIVAWCVNKDKEVYLVPGLYDIMLHDAVVMRIGDQPILKLGRLSLTPWQQVVKCVEDLFLASMLGLIGLILSPFIIVAIRLTSPGPVLYRQLRIGQDGKPFFIYKFRTMVLDAEKQTGPVMAAENDPRITRVGRFLRTTRLDEIPQVFNILKGEMSFVGPRPERPVFAEKFSEAIPAYAYRFKVKPGITGLAQVNGHYDTEPMDKLRYDLYYIRNYSLWLDLKILLQTLKVILTPETARGVAEKSGSMSWGLPGEPHLSMRHRQ